MSAIPQFILDAEHSEGNRLKVLLRNGRPEIVQDEFDPYVYLIPKNEKKARDELEQDPRVKRVESQDGRLRVVLNDPGQVTEFRHERKELGEFREHDIFYVSRYLIDRGIYAGRYYDFDVKAGRLAGFREAADRTPELRMCAFDIETYNKDGIPNAEKDPVLIIGYCDEREHQTFHWTPDRGSEKEMLKQFVERIKKHDPDVIVGYNSSGFDFPYLKKRAKALGVKLDLGRDCSEVEVRRGGISQQADIFGRAHIDAYDAVEFLTTIGALRLPKNDLDSVYMEFFKKDKIEVEGRDIYKFWEAGGEKLKRLIEYNKQDVTAAFEIGREILPLYVELSKIIGLPLYDVSRMAASQMVEWLLMREAHGRGELAPNRPGEDEVHERMMRPIKGAFVKLPESGLHERIVVCDFKSLYPSLIISYNVDPSTVNCKCCRDAWVAPEVGHRFCKKRRGLMPAILDRLIDARLAVKEEMKKHKRGSQEHRMLGFRQQALKILANASYGYLAYARARWYSRESAESVTAWARHYIQDTIKKAEEAGFDVLYADTDSLFIRLGERKVEEAQAFIASINEKLPERMELEFQGYYPRGIFVTKREGGAAKKRYALIREDGTVEIKGFEFVRRDWANIAKVAQEKVINAVLAEGKPKKAIDIVKQIIEDVREKKVKFEDVIIYTQVVRKVSSYEQQAPHVKAAKRLIQAGVKVSPGTILEYVVVPGKGSISDRSIPVQLLEKKDYDADYYIDNQVLPAVMKVLHELGVEEDELKQSSKQAGLKKWF